MRKGRRRAGQDIAWRQVLSHPTALEELLRDFVPEAAPLVDLLDFDRAKVVGGTFSDALLAELESDVIWRLPARARRDCVIYVHIEHQSTCERLMALRVLRYVGALYGAIAAERGRKRGAPLPLILPVVLYCGERAWNAPRRFEELLIPLPAAVTPPVTARYCLVDVKTIDDDLLARVRNALSALFQLEKARVQGATHDVEAVTGCMARERDRSLVEAVWIAAYTVIESTRGPEAAAPVRESFEAERSKERPMALTMGEFLIKWANEYVRTQEREEVLSSLHRAMRRRGLDPADYARELDAVKPLRKVVDLAVGVAAAKDPRAYMRRRFGH